MSRIPEALRKAQVEQSPRRGALVEKASRAESIPKELVALADSLHEGATNGLDGYAQSNWQLQDSLVAQGHSEEHVLAAEEVRKLYGWLLQKQRATSQGPLKCLLVTSAMPREGKTFLAVNLAWTMAQAKNQRVLLIDGDLRLSSAHQILGAPSIPGLAEYLEGQVEESQVLQRGPLTNLFFIPAGRRPNDPVGLLSNLLLKKLLIRLSPLFDWIILDSAPAVALSDGSLLAAFADAVLLVIGAGASSREAVAKARDLFADRGLLGAVFNYAHPRQSYSSYYYGYGEKQAQTK